MQVNNIYSKLQTFKCWIFIFTCASTRCVYLDLIPDCSLPSCIRVLKRFFAARGVPTLIVSDNGSQFMSNETHSFANEVLNGSLIYPVPLGGVACLNG